MAMALEGIKVLDLASVWAAPSAAMYLAEQGAEVIKVESPGGDEARRLFTHPALGNESAPFLVVNRNKRGIVVDLSSAEGKELVLKLALQADVVIQNWRPRVAKRLGLTYEDLEPLNPKIIYVELSAYGKKGPYAERPGYDLIFQALSGMMHRTLPDGTPMTAGVWAADCSTPLALAFGVAMALYVRKDTGHGQKVETSLLQMALTMQHVDLVKPEAEPPTGRAPSTQATFAPYKGSDGLWFLPVAVSDKEFVKYATVIGAPHLATESIFATSLSRAQHATELYPILEALWGTRTRAEWLELCAKADMACVPIVARNEVYEHPQVVANDMMTELVHPTAGRTKMINIPVKLSANPGKIRRPSPLQGQHTVEVLKELGYQQTDIDRLLKGKVVQQA